MKASQKSAPRLQNGIETIPVRPVRKRSGSSCKRWSDINVRFATPDDYALVKKAADQAEVSINKFIVDATLDAVRKLGLRKAG